MSKLRSRSALLTVSLAMVPPAVLAAADSPPVARYDMRAGTTSGMAASGGSGGGMGAAMGMMFGGGRGASVQHELYLRLGSARAAAGAARAEHFMPASAQLGKSVLLTPPPRAEEALPDMLPEKPKGRLLIYWGCGERARPGQPVVIDFAKLSAGQVPPGLYTSTILRDLGPSPENSKAFTRWPADDRKFVKANSSLLGPHRITSNYTPEMAFTLSQDFMAPLKVTTAAVAGGASRLTWTGIPGATGYLAFLTGGRQGAGGAMGDMVMWTSSADRQFGGGLSDWLSPAQVAGLVRSNTVLAPTATSCLVPAEVVRDTPDFRFGTLTAFGPEENFAYPPRPADARQPWKPEWTARIRHRSSTSWMEAQGMTLGQAAPDDTDAPKPNCKPKRGLGGILGGMVGVPAGC